MDMYQTNRQGRRPYTRTCGMNRTFTSEGNSGDKRNFMPGTCANDVEMYSHLQHLVPAMAYVPCQEMTETFELCYALKVGTIFPQLCKPFCGKRGGCR